jgi:hypothetical protein
MSNVHDHNADLSVTRGVLVGAVGFGLASLCVFATVAFGERWMYQHLTPAGSYVVWIALFIILGGTALGSLVAGRWRLPKFYLLFALAFFAYAIGWMAAYFTMQSSVGEWVGSLAGSILMAVVLATGFSSIKSIPKFALLLFVSNSLGYFIGALVYNYLGRPLGMLLWGIVYGICFGAGIGSVLQLSQTQLTR